MVGGAADLVESTKTVFEGAGEFSKVHAGRNVPFGIREHAMGAIVNGAAAHGGIVKPYGSTFLVFSDYMRASVRLSALMGLPVVWVWTHDSVGLGEDGPTHQPIEHYAALRAIPRLWVIRPADANETSVAWRVALERDDGPVALLLSRQNMPVLDRDEVAGSAEESERGGYVLWDSPGEGPVDGGGPEAPGERPGGDPDLHRRRGRADASGRQAARRGGSESARGVDAVHGAVRSPAAGVPRAVSFSPMPTRLAVEPGATMSWWKWVGSDGDVLGLDRFGASAPGVTVLEKLGFTAENIASRARALLERADEAGECVPLFLQGAPSYYPVRPRIARVNTIVIQTK